jgi:inositol polyphosphate 1-phosphatase
LSDEIHKIVSVNETLPDIKAHVCLEQLGIWIDPIDATSQYIEAKEESTSFENIQKSGLKCVTILIGAYDKETSSPVIGIINQPFYEKTKEEYKSKILWGVAIDDEKHSNVESSEITDKIAILSSTESHQDVLKNAGFKTITSAGAGYKILKVIESHACLYFLSKGTTFKWDSCAPHAILRSLDGDIIDLKESISNRKPISLTYREDEDKCNSNGLIAYRKIDDLMALLSRMM